VRLLRLSWESPWRAKRNLAMLAQSPFVKGGLQLKGVSVGKTPRFYGAPIIRRYRGSRILIGDHVEFRSSKGSNVLGLAHAVMLTTLSKQATITLGDSVGLSGTTICALEAVSIGARTLIGADVIITDTDHHALMAGNWIRTLEDAPVAPIVIGEDVFVGARAIILKGTRIGSGAVIGAGAVVSGTVAPHAVVAGNPARVVGTSQLCGLQGADASNDSDAQAGVSTGSLGR
jgi:acetyltransferase-like isoleucine patch superfamily enzyme